MKPNRIVYIGCVLAGFVSLSSCTTETKEEKHVSEGVEHFPALESAGSRSAAAHEADRPELAQVPTWTGDDLDFFLHGSMSTEVVPESVLKAFIRTYPDLFPTPDLSHLGLFLDPASQWPVGFSRGKVSHLGGLSAVGLNCAACHVGEVVGPGGKSVRVLGMTSHFDAEAYFGAVIVATFRTSDPANMKKFLREYLAAPAHDSTNNDFDSQWKKQEPKILEVMAADPFGAKGIVSGGLYALKHDEVSLDYEKLGNGSLDFAAFSQSMLKLFHNMRAALHVPDQPPDKAPPASGPGRNDAFGLLSAALFGTPQPYGPVKYGLIWNVDQRPWVHWDGNTRSPLGRNLLAALGLGAPLIHHHGELDFALVKRQTDLSEKIRPPRYPFAIDQSSAQRGKAHYQAQCASCHDAAESDTRLHAAGEVGTDPTRAEAFTPVQAGLFNQFLADLETPGYKPSSTPGLRSTQKYWAASLPGAWARAPYLHNGSVRTMQDLLTEPAARAKSFKRGSRAYDAEQMGFADEGPYALDTTTPGNSNVGHDYGTKLSATEKRDLIEFLKTL